MQSPYIPTTKADREIMLKEIGVESIEDLFEDIPEKFRHSHLNLPPPMSELSASKHLAQMARRNADLNEYACFLGAGCYRHFIPGTVAHLTGRSEFYTAYTPYQAEISQGTLQSIYEFQSLICQLTGMEVSNAGMYDVSTAAAEAAIMACAITRRTKIVLAPSVNPVYSDVIHTYATGRNLSVTVASPDSDSVLPESACLVVQQPNYFGMIEDLATYSRKAHDAGALFVVIVDPIFLGMFRPPGEYGSDIVVADGQSLGNPPSFGGPGLGIFTCRKELVRRMPGRIVGRTNDSEGRQGFVMTLVTREQHIRRETASSNICTSEALLSLAAAIYLATLGKTGLQHVASLCYHKSHYAAALIGRLKGYTLGFAGPFFKEFAITCPVQPALINRALFEEKIIGGLDISRTIANGMLLCVTEMNSKEEIDKLAEILARYSR
jgi:glycine dehydrogenase subunit 1